MTTHPAHEPPSPEDAAFARFRRTGDPDALAEVYDLLAPGLLRLALKLVGDPVAAEDALQATFLTALEDAARHDGRRPVRPWLSGVLGNHVRSHRRREGRPLDAARVPRPGDAVDPHQHAAHADLQRAVQQRVDAMPEAWHAPILLRVRDGLTATEIATRLGRPAGTIRSQLARGLERLRTGLASTLAVLAWHTPKGRTTTTGQLTLLGGLIIIPTLLLMVALSTPAPSEPAPANVIQPVAPMAAGPVTRPTLAPEPAPPATRITPLPSPALATVNAGVVSRPATSGDEFPDPLGPLPVLVLGVDGDPQDGAQVEVWSDRETYDLSQPAQRVLTTDGNGGCQVTLSGDEVVAARNADTASLAFGRIDARVVQRRDPAGRLVLALQSGCRVTGVVVGPDGEPRPAARVRLSRAGGVSQRGQGRQPPALELDDQGRFEIDLAAGTIWRFSPHLGELRGPSWRIHTKSGAEHDLQLMIPGDWRLHGVVHDATGAAVAGAQVWSWPARPRPDVLEDIPTVEIETVGRSTRSDDQGRFVMNLESTGSWLVQARADGHPPGNVLEVEVTARRPTAPLTLRLPRAASIGGRVVDSAGEPVADVSVAAVEPGWPSAPAWTQGPSHTERYGKARTTTDDSGAFMLDGLHPDGVFELRASRESLSGFAPRLTLGDVQAGRTDILLVLADTQLARFHGRVVEADGVTPVPHFEIDVSRQTDSGWVRLTHEYRDEHGRFSVDDLDPTLPLAFRIQALEAESELFEQFGIEIPSQRTDLAPLDLEWATVPFEAEAITLRLQRPGSLEVSVLDEHGAPQAFVEVLIACQRQLRAASYTRPKRSDEQGVVTFEGVAPGSWRVSAPGFAPQTLDVVEGQRARVALSPE